MGNNAYVKFLNMTQNNTNNIKNTSKTIDQN